MQIDDTLGRAIRHHQSGELEKAAVLYKEILSLQPDYIHALHYLGVVYIQSGRFDLAIPLIERAVQLAPADSHAFYNLGIAYQQSGLLDKAIPAYEKAVGLDPGNAEAYVNLGIILKNLNRLEDAEICLRNALHNNPAHVQANNNLGVVLREKGLIDEAIACYEAVLRTGTTDPFVYANLASALREKGRISESITHLRKALSLNPDVPEMLFQLATALMEEGQGNEARLVLEKILSVNPNAIEARLAHCISHLQIVYMKESEIAKARENYNRELLKLCDNLKDREALPRGAERAVGLLQPFYLPYQGLNDRDLQQMYGDLTCRIMSAGYPDFSLPVPVSPPSHEGRLRIGFVSGYFYNHSVWNIPTKGWVQYLDKQKFELFGYYTWRLKDEETEFAKQHFNIFIPNIRSFDELCTTIRRADLHVLIYPEIGMDPVSLKLAALRLAPIQCVSWGHPTTTGLPTIDFYLSSERMEPPDGDEHYTEKLIRLPDLSFCLEYPRFKQTDVDRSFFNLSPESTVYHCCQSLYKYLPQYDEVFPRIAQEVGNCQFVFSSYPRSERLTNQFRERISDAFRQLKLNPESHIIFLPFLEESYYSSLYRLTDIFLDPIGWSGCNSVLHAIAYNVPVVTFPGGLMRSRDASAILSMMDLHDCIAKSVEEYTAIAVKLGQNVDWRGAVSHTIAENKHRIYNNRKSITGLEGFLEKAVYEKLA
jgi:protein O-GlcNAc transferase